IGHEDEKLALREILDRPLFSLRNRRAGAEEIAEKQRRITLLAPSVANGEKLAESAIGKPVGWIGDDVRRAIGEDEAHTGGIPEIGTALLVVARRHIATHHSGKAVAVA